jgi:predicted nucleotidyltransferase
MQKELQLDTLPASLQRATIVEICTRLWQHDDVIALWLGGSLAREAGDVFSDIDFRVAVALQDLPAWQDFLARE